MTPVTAAASQALQPATRAGGPGAIVSNARCPRLSMHVDEEQLFAGF
jgi:hypothetical protein